MVRILGIDPGSRRTGYGVIDFNKSKVTYVSSGIIRLPNKDLPVRLKIIFDGVTEIIEQFSPQTMGIEEVFFAKDPRAALKLGQARGAAIVAGANAQLSVGEYSPRSIKQAVVGTGSADKKQIQIPLNFGRRHLVCLATDANPQVVFSDIASAAGFSDHAVA